MKKLLLLLIIVVLIPNILFAKKTPTKFSCDKCGEDITYIFIYFDGSDAENEITCFSFGTRSNAIKYQLCDKHYKQFHKIMGCWLKVK